MGVYFDFKEAELTSYGGKDSHLHHTYTIKNLPNMMKNRIFASNLRITIHNIHIYVKSLFEKNVFLHREIDESSWYL